jgi:hypothetical protein
MAETIKGLLALDDATLSKKIGLDNKLQDFKAQLTKAQGLSAVAQADVETKLNKMFGPQDYMVSDFGYTVDSAARRDAKKDDDPCECLKSFDCCDVAEVE